MLFYVFPCLKIRKTLRIETNQSMNNWPLSIAFFKALPHLHYFNLRTSDSFQNLSHWFAFNFFFLGAYAQYDTFRLCRRYTPRLVFSRTGLLYLLRTFYFSSAQTCGPINLLIFHYSITKIFLYSNNRKIKIDSVQLAY